MRHRDRTQLEHVLPFDRSGPEIGLRRGPPEEIGGAPAACSPRATPSQTVAAYGEAGRPERSGKHGNHPSDSGCREAAIETFSDGDRLSTPTG
jgi:hypothetical protein